MKLRSLRVAPRLGLAFGTLILFLLISGAVCVVSLGRVQAASEAMYRDSVESLQRLKQVSDAYSVTIVSTVAKVNAGLITAPEAVQSLQQAREAADNNWAPYMATKMQPEEAQLAREAQELFGPANAQVTQAVTLLKPFDDVAPGELNALQRPLYAAIDPISDKLTALTDQQLNAAQMLNDVVTAQHQWARWVTFGVIAGAVLVALLLGWAISRSITAPLNAAIRAATAIRDGDLSRGIAVDGRDEAGDMLAALRDMQASLAGLVNEVRSGVESVTTASGQIAAGNQDLSGRTEQQAGSLQQTAGSIEQITTTVRQNADSAQQALQLAGAARAAADRGGAVVSQVVGTMDEITAASRKIADITGVIDGIAFQTNILALNAAVEAARAGDQGRGFAVVAGEVRTLARRSAEAAREIKSLIGGSSERVEAGSRQVADAGSAMKDIVTQVHKVSGLIGEIATAVTEQSSGIGQVNQAISQMDRATQQNAALVEQSAAAAGSLAEQARRLSSVVAGFRLA